MKKGASAWLESVDRMPRWKRARKGKLNVNLFGKICRINILIRVKIRVKRKVRFLE